MSTPPNILLLMDDEHRYDAFGHAGDPVACTPTIDRLAREGAVLDACYAASPVCIPARQCLMAGQLPKTCGALVYGDDLRPGARTWARHFAEHGYRTICCGKLHHLGQDQMQGWMQRPAGDCEATTSGRPDLIPGKWSYAEEIRRAAGGTNPYAVLDERWTRTAEEVIEETFVSPFYDRPATGPVLLKVSLLRPHYPFVCAPERFSRYLNRVRPYLEPPDNDHPYLGARRRVEVGREVTARDVQRATAAYYGMIEEVDAAFARVLEALVRAGQDLDQWIIVFTSDHGEMLGQHGVWEKSQFYEASVRVPLVVRAPGRVRAGHRVAASTSACDLYATLCGLAGLPVPGGLDSRDLGPLLAGGPAPWEDEAVAAYHDRSGAANLMIRRGHLKYQWYGPALPEVVFDLAADPGECHNAIDDPQVRPHLAAFRTRRDQLGYG